MRLLDYQRYDVEVGEGCVFFEAPMRDKPSGNRLERIYQRMVQPMPGLTEADARVWRYIYIYPEHNNRPVSRSGQHVADQSPRPGPDPRRLCVLPRGEPERRDARRSSA